MNSRWTDNLIPAERIARILIGLAALVGGVILFIGPGTAVAQLSELLLVMAGIDLVVAGATGHCPLYQKLGRPPVVASTGATR